MLKSSYHAVFLGQTPFSLIHALLLRQEGQDVLVVDDAELSTDSPGVRRLGLLERAALQELGEKFQLRPLKALHHYMHPTTISIHLPSLQWMSGPTVKDNLREFVRKFNFLQTPLLLQTIERADTELQAELEKACADFVRWFNSPLVRQRPVASYGGTGSPWVDEFQRLIGEEQSRPYHGPAVSTFTQLLASYTTGMDQTVKYELSPHEAWSIGLRLLSPVWELDRRWFERELIRELHERGGHTKKTSIRSWQVYKQRVEAALLESYEGVISHERLLLYGLPPLNGQLQCQFAARTFRGIEFAPSTTRPAPVIEQVTTHLVTFTASELMGTAMPVGFFEGHGNEGRMVALVADAPTSKQEFFAQEAWNFLTQHLARALPAVPTDALGPRGLKSWGHWVEDAATDQRPQSKTPLLHHERRKVQVVDRVSQEPLTGVEFWGPLRAQRFGTVGFLADLRGDLG